MTTTKGNGAATESIPRSLRVRVASGAERVVTASRADHLAPEDFAEMTAAVDALAFARTEQQTTMQQAEQLVAQAQQQAQNMIGNAIAMAVKAEGIEQYLRERFRRLYALGDGDDWDASGAITRAAAPDISSGGEPHACDRSGGTRHEVLQ